MGSPPIKQITETHHIKENFQYISRTTVGHFQLARIVEAPISYKCRLAYSVTWGPWLKWLAARDRLDNITDLSGDFRHA